MLLRKKHFRFGYTHTRMYVCASVIDLFVASINNHSNQLLLQHGHEYCLKTYFEKCNMNPSPKRTKTHSCGVLWEFPHLKNVILSYHVTVTSMKKVLFSCLQLALILMIKSLSFSLDSFLNHVPHCNVYKMSVKPTNYYHLLIHFRMSHSSRVNQFPLQKNTEGKNQGGLFKKALDITETMIKIPLGTI